MFRPVAWEGSATMANGASAATGQSSGDGEEFRSERINRELIEDVTSFQRGRPAGKRGLTVGRDRQSLANQSGCPDSNRGPRRPKRRALPGCATPREVRF